MKTVNQVLEEVEAYLLVQRISDAIALLWEGLADNPDALMLRARLADCLVRDGQDAAALDNYRTCIMAYAERGELPGAIGLYRQIQYLFAEGEAPANPFRPLLREAIQRCINYHRMRIPTSNASPINLLTMPFFSSLSADELEEVVDKLTLFRVGAGDLIFRQGDEGSSLFIITKGRVRVFLTMGRGNRVDLGALNPGEFFGEWSLLTGAYRRHAWVEAEQDTELFELTTEALETIKKSFPRVEEVLQTFYDKRRLDVQIARLFPTLSPDERTTMALLMERDRMYPKGTRLYYEGDTSRFLSIIEKGTIEIYTYNFEGARTQLALLGPGQMFGEGSLISGRPRSASVRARTDVVLHHISSEKLIPLLSGHPEIMAQLEQLRSDRLEDAYEKLLSGIQDRRRLSRLPYNGPLTILVPQRRTSTIRSSACDISRRGVCFETSEAIDAEEIWVTLNPDDPTATRVQAQISWNQAREDGTYIYGARFLDELSSLPTLSGLEARLERAAG